MITQHIVTRFCAGICRTQHYPSTLQTASSPGPALVKRLTHRGSSQPGRTQLANGRAPPQLHLASEVQKKLNEYITAFRRT